jgi:drug/metabolite transporter (DMT)-like permease
MSMFYISITVTILSSALYHFSQRSTPQNANPAAALLVTYAVAMGLPVALLYFVPANGGLLAEVRRLNWASYLLALAVVGLEIGFLLAYRSGWSIGLAAVLVNVAASLILVPVALLYFRDRLSWVNLAGIVVCLVGLVLLNWNR